MYLLRSQLTLVLEGVACRSSHHLRCFSNIRHQALLVNASFQLVHLFLHLYGEKRERGWYNSGHKIIMLTATMNKQFSK